MSNPVLFVDYVVPTISGIGSATFDYVKNQLVLNVTGAGEVGDRVDVTKIAWFDYYSGTTYHLTNDPITGSMGSVKNPSLLVINIGSSDMIGITNLMSSNVSLNISSGSLLTDFAGNCSIDSATTPLVPVTIKAGLDSPTNVTISPVGTNVIANTLNSSTLYINASAKITANQATGGRAELYIGGKLVATDDYISATDSEVNFTTADETPTSYELHTTVPFGGIAVVKLYNVYNIVATSETESPTIMVDYTNPSILGPYSAIYNVSNKMLWIFIDDKVSDVGDKIDVTMLSLYDATLNRTYQLTDTPIIGSQGMVVSKCAILVKIGSSDILGLADYGKTTVTLNIGIGSLVSDASGNCSKAFTEVQTGPVIIVP